jgi:hypothetical protein
MFQVLQAVCKALYNNVDNYVYNIAKVRCQQCVSPAAFEP